jgi:oligopeptidase B
MLRCRPTTTAQTISHIIRMQSSIHVPPKAHTIPHASTLHGLKRIDNYQHLRKLNRNTKRYLEQELDYTKKMMQHTSDLQETLYQEMKSRINEVDISVPSRYLDFLYYHRTEENKQHTIYCRKRADDPNAQEEILLDLNVIAEQEEAEYVYVDCFKISPDQNLLAYTIDYVSI